MRTDSAPRSGTSPRPEETAPPRASTGAPPAAAAAPTPDPAPLAPGAPATVAVPAPAPLGMRRPLSRRTRLYLGIGIVLLAVLFLLAVRSIVRPFIWAAVVAYILNPVVRQVQKRTRLRHGLSVALVMLVLVGVVAWGVTAAIGPLRADVVAVTSSLSALDNFFTTYVPNAGTLSILGLQIQVPQLIRNAQSAITDSPRLVLHSGWSVASGLIDTLLRLLTFLLSTIYLLLDGTRLRAWLRTRIPTGYRDDAVALGRSINTVLSEYLRAEVILILIMSTASLIALTILGVRFAIVLAPIVGFLEIFPIIGPFFAIAMVSLVALIGPPGLGLPRPGYALIVALVFFIMRQVEDYLVIPSVVGHAVKLHPVLILFALLSGATLGGILGMFLAVPVTGALKVLGTYAYDRLVE